MTAPYAIRNPRFLEVADRIAYRLCRDAIWSGDRCNWLGWSSEPAGVNYVPAYRALSPTLYDGVAGVAIFLATLWQFTHDRHERRILEGAVQQLLATRDLVDAPASRGYYTGWTGIAYALVRAGEILGAEKLIDAGVAMLSKMRGVPMPNTCIDVMSGAAGTIPVLLDVAKRHQVESLVDVAREHGELLLALRQDDGLGTSWPSPLSKRNLTGFSHGAAGIALALLEIHRVTGDVRSLAAGLGGIRYERNAFDRAADNWPDYRIDPTNPQSGPKHATAWCNGATGIGYVRLRLLELVPNDPETPTEIDTAMRAAIRALTAAYPQSQADATLCHGISGNADFLLETATRFARADLRTLVEGIGENAMKTYHDPGLPWPCGVPGGGENPGLLLGTSGIGYFYLRLFDADCVESILVLRPGRSEEHVNG